MKLFIGIIIGMFLSVVNFSMTSTDDILITENSDIKIGNKIYKCEKQYEMRNK